MKSFLLSLSTLALVFAFAAPSEAQQQAANVTFINSTQLPAEVKWMSGGQQIRYATLQPGQSYTQPTFLGHNWSISNGRVGMGGPVTQNGQVYRLSPPMQVQPIGPQPPVPPQPQAQGVNANILKYAQASLGRRLGNGQCTELVVQALQAANAKPGQFGRNYVWGTRLNGVQQLQPGDIVQMMNAAFTNPDGSQTWSTGPHTAIVEKVENGTVHVLEQNVAGSPVQRGTFNEKYKTAGTLTYYRAISNGQRPVAPFNQ